MKVLLCAPNEEELRELYWQQGLSLQKIGDQLGVCLNTVRNWMLLYGMERRTLKQAHRFRNGGDKCRKCGVNLPDYKPYTKAGRLCAPCRKQYWKDHQAPIEVRRARATNWRRRRRITTSDGKGGQIHLIGEKRPYTDKCEICGRPPKTLLHYHHWDNSNLLKGLWLCPTCHHAITVIESYGQAVYGKYIIIKDLVEKEVENHQNITMCTK